ncbi:MAG: dTMP kinase [Methylacidiphilales bacterium]|nr:dTMP kinase [Candidatus Methylacidiphilales bacterium]
MGIGKFVVLEGLDGVGKTTQLNRLKNRLLTSGFKVHSTQEPGGIELGDFVRVAIKEKRFDWKTNLFLLLAMRNRHVITEILPRLKEGYWVLCDRFVDSTYVYQGIEGGFSAQFLDQCHNVILPKELIPITIYLDISIDKLLTRISSRSILLDRYEIYLHSNHGLLLDKMRDMYLQRFQNSQDKNKILIDASTNEDETFSKICSYLNV